MKSSEGNKITHFLSSLNFYRKIRESLVSFYLSKTANADKINLTISWQPLLLIAAKIAIVLFISYKIYELHPIVGSWMKIGLDFFKLHEIYTFKFPNRSFFNTVSSYVFLFILGYHGIFFLYHQLTAFFSVIVVSKSEEKLYYIKSYFIKKELFIFSIPDIALIILKQNFFYRFFDIGTISLQKKSGEQIIIKSIKEASKLLKELTEIKKPYDLQATKGIVPE